LRNAVFPAPSVPVPSAPPSIEEALVPWGNQGDRLSAGLTHPRRPARTATLFLHGNGENLGTLARGKILQRLESLPAHVLIIDYPGYGRSTGDPSESTLIESGRAALSWLHRRYPELPLTVVGFSLGAAVAVQLAATNSPPLTGLVLLAPWTSLLDAASLKAPRFLARAFLCDRFESERVAAYVQVPTLVIHGTLDDLIAAEQGRRVASRLPKLHRLWMVPGARHNDLLARKEVWEQMAEFLASRRPGDHP
jgi:uncharacterized protein